jgi:hypothetical protein
MELHNDSATTLQHASDLQTLTSPAMRITVSSDELEALTGQGEAIFAGAAFDALLSKLSSDNPQIRQQALTSLHDGQLSAFNIYQLHALAGVLIGNGDTTGIESVLNNLNTRAEHEYRGFFNLLNHGALQSAQRLVTFDLVSINQHTIREQCINALLREEIAALGIELQQQLLTHPDDTKSLLKVLQHLPSDEAVILLEDIHTLASSNNVIKEELSELWDNAIANCSEDVRIEFCKRLLAAPYSDVSSTVRSVLESSEDLDTLVRIVHTVGVENLPNTAEIQEICATAILYPQIQSCLTSQYLDTNSSVPQVESSLEELRSMYQRIIEICEQDSAYRSTEVARDIRAMATQSLADLEGRKASLDEQITLLQQRFIAHGSHEQSAHEQLLEFYNTNRKIAELQLQFGVSIGYDVTSPLDYFVDPQALNVPNWTLEELQAVETSLRAIPEGHLIFSPLLFEIQKVKYLGSGVLAARYYDGVIKVAQSAGESSELNQHYPNVTPLAFVLTHEIGHGLQIGRGNLHYEDLDPSLIDDGEQRYSFDDYAKLSKWEVISSERWELIEPLGYFDTYQVKLDGQLYPIGEPIEHNGERVILQLRGADILLVCSAQSEFASRWYAKVSPWEDFAEAFAEYILCPEQLIDYAPTKFLFLEEEFRKYKDNQEILDLADKRAKESMPSK